MKSATLFQNQPVVELADDSSRVLVTPNHGARILRWEKAGREIITWPENADWSRFIKIRGGNPVLFPFAARHFVDGKMEFWRDGAGTVRPMPMHGFCRDAKFTVIEDDEEAAVRMRVSDSEATRGLYPFAFDFDVVVMLLPEAQLEIRFETTNRSETPLPYYAGHHFYFALDHATRADWALDLPCAEWGRQNPDGSIRREPATNGVLTLDDPAPIDRFQIEPRRSQITLRNSRTGQHLGMDLASPTPWYAVTTWTAAPESDFYCIEPWLGLPNAIHHGEGLRWIDPGQTEIAVCRLDAAHW